MTTTEVFVVGKRPATGRRSAWINDLQGVWLESGVNRASPGSTPVEPALARLAAQVLLKKRLTRLKTATRCHLY
jgi:hypothetical protein